MLILQIDITNVLFIRHARIHNYSTKKLSKFTADLQCMILYTLIRSDTHLSLLLTYISFFRTRCVDDSFITRIVYEQKILLNSFQKLFIFAVGSWCGLHGSCSIL